MITPFYDTRKLETNFFYRPRFPETTLMTNELYSNSTYYELLKTAYNIRDAFRFSNFRYESDERINPILNEIFDIYDPDHILH